MERRKKRREMAVGACSLSAARHFKQRYLFQPFVPYLARKVDFIRGNLQ